MWTSGPRRDRAPLFDCVVVLARVASADLAPRKLNDHTTAVHAAVTRPAGSGPRLPTVLTAHDLLTTRAARLAHRADPGGHGSGPRPSTPRAARGSRPAAEAERARARRAAFPSARRASVHAPAPVCDATPGRRRAVSPRFAFAESQSSVAGSYYWSISFPTRTQGEIGDSRLRARPSTGTALGAVSYLTFLGSVKHREDSLKEQHFGCAAVAATRAAEVIPVPAGAQRAPHAAARSLRAAHASPIAAAAASRWLGESLRDRPAARASSMHA